MPQKDFADNFNRRAGTTCVSRGKPPQVMRPHIDTNKVTGLFYDNSCGTVLYRENPVIGINSSFENIFVETFSNFSWKKCRFHLPATFGISNYGFAIFNITGGQLQVTDSHASAGHEFQQQTVPFIFDLENDFVDNILFQYYVLTELLGLEKLPQRWIFAWVLKIGIDGLCDEI